jgi:hypothetical protein
MKDLIKQILREEYTGNIDYSYKDMEDAFLDVFSEHKRKETAKYLEGIIDIYTIGERIGDKDINWSIINFFDSNRTLKPVILKDLRTIEFDNIIDGLKQLLSDETKLNGYVDLVWEKIKKGFEAENNFISRLKAKNKNVEYSGEPGTKEDKFGGVDAKVGGKGVQVKHAYSVNKLFTNKEGKDFYRVIIKGTESPNYRQKRKVHFLAFYVENEDTFFIFQNTGYSQKYDKVKKINILTFNKKPWEI